MHAWTAHETFLSHSMRHCPYRCMKHDCLEIYSDRIAASIYARGAASDIILHDDLLHDYFLGFLTAAGRAAPA